MNIKTYTDRGVIIPCPESVEIDEAIPPDRIAPGVVVHAGSRIQGSETSIGPGCVIGAEAPATVLNCQLAHGVSLKGGFYSFATFLDNSSMGSGAHVREGTLLEEEATAAHTVGLKQTILFPYVTAGSLINFCDCLMAGGTGRKNHSEIGSSYIHFNFTPRQDKATASLIGDVPRGVMLDQNPVFLGGQGGLVGPSRIAFGTTIAAGTICRKDILAENRIYTAPAAAAGGLREFDQAQYRDIRRTVVNNLLFIGNLHALHAWYRFVRKKYMADDAYRRLCWTGAIRRIENAVSERVKQLGTLADKIPRSLEIADAKKNLPPELRLQQETFSRQWPEMESGLEQGPPDKTGESARERFLEEWNAADGGISYLEAVKRISPGGRVAGTKWLQEIADYAQSLWNPDLIS